MGSFGQIVTTDTATVRKVITEPNGYDLEIAVFELPSLWYLRNVEGVVRILNDNFDEKVSFTMEKHQRDLYLLEDHEVNEYFESIADQLINIFTTINRMGIAHADIKPSNVMFDLINNQIKMTVIDFGESRLLPFLTPENRAIYLAQDATLLLAFVFMTASFKE